MNAIRRDTLMTIAAIPSLAAVSLALALAAGPIADPELADFGVDDFEITAVNPPKHFYLNLRNTRTGEELERAYVAKHFNDWREVKAGSVIRVAWKKHTVGGETKTTIDRESVLLSLRKAAGK